MIAHYFCFGVFWIVKFESLHFFFFFFLILGHCGQHWREIGIRRNFQNDAGRRGAKNTPAEEHGYPRGATVLRFVVHYRRHRDAGLVPRKTHFRDVYDRCKVYYFVAFKVT